MPKRLASRHAPAVILYAEIHGPADASVLALFKHSQPLAAARKQAKYRHRVLFTRVSLIESLDYAAYRPYI